MRRISRAVGFTLIEVLVVVAVIALLAAILLPSLSRARQSAQRAGCLANIRSLALAQVMYANVQKDLLVVAGDGSYDIQGSWIGLLERESAHALVRRCPSDRSRYFESLYSEFDPPVHRVTSYGINNYISPTHVPLGVEPVSRLSQVKRPAGVVQFVEMAESGTYAVADHLHVQKFFNPLTPQATPARVEVQMPLGRHGGRPAEWSGVLSYSFLDGHAETLPLRSVYTDPRRNRFNPAVAP